MKIVKEKNIKEILKPILNKKCWNARVGHGSFLNFEFGEMKVPAHYSQRKSRDPNKEKKLIPAIGEWHFWIYMCNWEIYHNYKLIAHSEDETEDMEKGVKNFDGLRLISIDPFSSSGTSEFYFEDNYILKTFPYEDEDDDDDHWMIYCPDGNVFTLQSANRWTYEKSSK